MTLMIETAGAAPAGRRAEPQQAGGQSQARWLLDLEQALLEQGLKPYQGAREEAPTAMPEPGRSLRRQDPRERDALGAQAATAPVQPAAGEAGAAGQGSTAAEPAGPGGQAAAVRPWQQAAGVPGVLPQSLDDAGLAGAAQQAPAWMASAAAPTGLAAQPAQAEAEAAPVLPALSVAGASQLALGARLAGAGAEAGAASEPGEALPAAQPPATAGEPFEKKLLHLYYGSDGIHAWLRDAELQAGQMRTLAQALATELGGEGKRLASLTVNGKKVQAASGNAGEEAVRAVAPPANNEGSNN